MATKTTANQIAEETTTRLVNEYGVNANIEILKTLPGIMNLVGPDLTKRIANLVLNREMRYLDAVGVIRATESIVKKEIPEHAAKSDAMLALEVIIMTADKINDPAHVLSFVSSIKTVSDNMYDVNTRNKLQNTDRSTTHYVSNVVSEYIKICGEERAIKIAGVLAEVSKEIRNQELFLEVTRLFYRYLYDPLTGLARKP